MKWKDLFHSKSFQFNPWHTAKIVVAFTPKMAPILPYGTTQLLNGEKMASPTYIETARERIEREIKESMIPDTELFASFDAQVWAREFVKHNLAYHIGLDEGALTAWFASAMMRGYDEHRYRTKGYKRSIRRALHPWWSWRRYFTPLSRFGR